MTKAEEAMQRREAKRSVRVSDEATFIAKTEEMWSELEQRDADLNRRQASIKIEKSKHMRDILQRDYLERSKVRDKLVDSIKKRLPRNRPRQRP